MSGIGIVLINSNFRENCLDQLECFVLLTEKVERRDNNDAHFVLLSSRVMRNGIKNERVFPAPFSGKLVQSNHILASVSQY